MADNTEEASGVMFMFSYKIREISSRCSFHYQVKHFHEILQPYKMSGKFYSLIVTILSKIFKQMELEEFKIAEVFIEQQS